MAHIEGRYFTGSITDKRHEADGIAEYFKRFLSSGLWNQGNDLLVSAASSLSVSINYGAAMISGYLFRIINNDNTPLILSVEPDAATRYDRVVVFKNAENVGIEILHGGTSPPELTRTDAEYQISLAKITIDATGITAVEDERFSSFCGLVSVAGAGLDAMPVGFSMPWWNDTLPSGKWMFGEGQSLSGYPAAAAIFGEALPDTRGRALVGKADSGTFGATGDKVGKESTTDILKHTHSIAHNHGSVNSGTESADHAHYTSGWTDNGGSHQHTACLGSYKVGSGSGSSYYYFTNSGGTNGQGTQGGDGTHAHSFGAWSGGRNTAHYHGVSIPNYSGNSGETGAVSLLSLVQPSIVCRWIFKIL